MHRAGNTTRTPLLNTTAELKRERERVSKEHQKKIPPRVIKITLDCQKQRRKREREKTTVRLSRNSSE